MKRQPFHALFAIALLTLTGAAYAADDGLVWQTDYKAALKEAKSSNKPLFVDFTGSDWCGWCIKQDKDTFSKPEFASYAKENLVLLTLDYPQGKPQSDALKKQNEELAEKYKVEGFPTLVLIDGNGKEIDRHVGYLAGGPAAMIDWIKKETAKK